MNSRASRMCLKCFVYSHEFSRKHFTFKGTVYMYQNPKFIFQSSSLVRPVIKYQFIKCPKILKDTFVQEIILKVPKIRKFSFQENVVEGEMVSVTCITSSKSPTVSYAWMKNGVTLGDSAENTQISNTEHASMLILGPVYLSDNGNYSCLAENSFGKDQYTARLIVKAPPRWIISPSDVVTTLGETVDVECAALGSPEPLVKFKKLSGARMIGEAQKRPLWNGSDESSGKNVLKLRASAHEQAGTFQCEADNGIFPPIRANFTILIRYRPQIKKFTFENNAKEGDLISVMCLATSSVKPVHFKWKKNDVSIPENNLHSRIKDDESYSVLLFDSVSLSDSGNYSCIASNADGEDEHTAHLHVKAPPKWEEEPRSLTAFFGSSVSIECKASGSPQPKITWKKITDKNEVLQEESSNILTISRVDIADSGTYMCVADNGIPPPITSHFTININGMVLTDKPIQ